MSMLWYCCGCNFGPFNPDLYDSCINCGKDVCAKCTREKFSMASDTLEDPWPSQLSPEATPLHAVRTSPPPYWQRHALDLRWSLLRDKPQAGPYLPIHSMYHSNLNLLIQMNRKTLSKKNKDRLRGELERLFLWGESCSISTQGEEMDAMLEQLPELRATIAITLGKVEDVISRYLSQDLTAESNEEIVSETIEDMSVYIDCLMDLSSLIRIYLPDEGV